MESNIKYIFDDEVYSSVKSLNSYLKKSGYYKNLDKALTNRDSGMRILGEIDNTKIQYKYLPNRKVVPVVKHKPKEGTCPLCIGIQQQKLISPINKVKGLIFRNYLIKPNTFPYFKNHLLIISLDHNHGSMGDRGTQLILHQNISVIYDFVDLIALLKKGTLFFNGLIGNSQLHFHFQYTTEDLPIKKYLLTQQTKKETFKTLNKTKIYIFKINESKCLNGIMLKGPPQSIYKDIFKIVQNVAKRDYLYNIILYNSTDKKNTTCIIFIRKKLKTESVFNFDMGAASLSGVHFFTEKKCFYDKNIGTNIAKYCDLTVIPIKIEFIKQILH